MEADANPFPEVNLGIADRARSVGQKIIGLCSYFPSNPEVAYPSEHRRGAAAMLDAALDQPQLPFEPMDGEALTGYAEIADSIRG